MLVCGVDEVGRGALCGPVVVSAVILGENYNLSLLNDSKKLSAKVREQLAQMILEQAIHCTIAQSSAAEIDELNIANATYMAMQRAVDGLVVCPDIVYVDGQHLPDLPYPAEAIVGGDGKIPEIMAASIVAKVHRDQIMQQLDEQYPGYSFAANKGYPTSEHLQALNRLGVIEKIYRKTYKPVASILANCD